MNVEVNLWAVLLATASSMVVGSIWYAKGMFGTMWARLAKVDLKNMGKGSSGVRAMLITVVVSFLTAYILAHMIFLSHHFFNNSFFQDAIDTAFWAWLGFTAARIITHDAFEARPAKLTALNCAHELVTLVVMAAIIGWIGV